MATDTAASDIKLVQDSPIQTNGDVSNKTIVFGNPLPQRTLRLNRRGFFMSSDDRQKLTESTSTNNKAIKSYNQELNSTKAPDKRQRSTSPSEKKIIKLSGSSKYSDTRSNHSAKHSTYNTSTQFSQSGKKIIKVSSSSKYSEDSSDESQKRSSGDFTQKEESQPKKKHKPITWP